MYRKLILFGFVLVLMAFSVNAGLNDNLEHYYKLDGDFTDEVGTNDLSNSGATSTATGFFNSAYSFDGSNDYLYTSTVSSFSSDFTVMGWVKIDASEIGGIFGQPDVGNTNTINKGWSLWEYVSSSNQLGITACDGSNDPCYQSLFSSGISTGSYYHIAVTRSDTTFKVYVNGQIKFNTTTSYLSSNEQFRIGYGNRLSGGDWSYDDMLLNGDVDEVSIYSRALPTDEIRLSYNSGSGVEYPFPSGDDCDYSGTGNWVIDESCHVDTNTKLQSGSTMFVTNGATVWVDSGVSIT